MFFDFGRGCYWCPGLTGGLQGYFTQFFTASPTVAGFACTCSTDQYYCRMRVLATTHNTSIPTSHAHGYPPNTHILRLGTTPTTLPNMWQNRPSNQHTSHYLFGPNLSTLLSNTISTIYHTNHTPRTLHTTRNPSQAKKHI